MNTQTQNAKWTVWDKDVLAARRAAAKPTPKIESVTPLVNFIHDGVILAAKTAGNAYVAQLQARIAEQGQERETSLRSWTEQIALLGKRIETERERADQLERDYAGVLKDLAQLPQVSQAPPPMKTYPQLLHALNQADEECTTYLNERNEARAERDNLQAQVDFLQRQLDDKGIEVQQVRGAAQVERDHEPKKQYDDALSLAYLREWWKGLSDVEKIAQPSLVADLVKPWHKRGAAWSGVVMTVSKHGQRIGITPFEASEAATAKAGRRNVAKGQGAIQRTPPDSAA